MLSHYNIPIKISWRAFKKKFDLFFFAFTFQHVDEENSYLCGYLQINGLTDEYPTLTTFFDGEIISQKYPFLTRKWDADEDVDKKHWVITNYIISYQIIYINILFFFLSFLKFYTILSLSTRYRVNLIHFANIQKLLIQTISTTRHYQILTLCL